MDPQPHLFRHRSRLHFRYDDPTHLPGFYPSPFPRHLPPLPPPPPPPHPAHPSLLPFSPPRYSVIERSRFYEFNPPPKPNFDSNTLPPPPPRVNLPLRFGHDYSDRNDNFGRRCGDNFIDRLPPENLHWGAAQLNNKVSDSGFYERYSNLSLSGHRLYDERHGTDERRWGIGINGQSHDLYNERDGDQKRIGYDINDRAHELYNGRYDNPRRWGYGTNDRVYELHKNEGNDDQRRWGYGTNDRACELHNESDDDRMRRNYGINGWGCELYNDRDHDRRRRGYGIHDGFMLQPDNRQNEILDSDLGSGRFSCMLGNGASEKDFIRYSKKRKVQRVSSSCRNELGKACRRRTGDYHSQHISEESRSYSFGGKGKEDLEGLVSGTEDKKEREQYRLELAISFKSNALVAEAILTPASPAVNLGMDITHINSNIREENSIPSSPLAKYSKDMVKSDVLAGGLDSQSDAREISEELLEKSTVSGSGSGITSDSKLSGNNVENEPQEDSINLQMTSDRGEITSDNIDTPSAVLHHDVYTTLREIQKVPDTVLVSKKVDVEGYPNEPSGPNSERKRSFLITLPSSLQVADNMVTQCPGHTEKLLTSTENTYHGCQFRIDEAEGRVDETVLANEDIGHGDSLGFSQHTDHVDISVREADQREDTQLPAYTTTVKCSGTTSGEVKVDKENFSSSDMGKTLEDDDKLLVKDNLAKDVQMGLSGPNNNEHHETASSSNGEVAQVWANDFVSAAEVKIPHERDSCEEDGSSSEGTFGVEDSSLGVDFGAEGSFPFRKKRKVANPILTPSPLSEDDLIADGITSNHSKLDLASSPLPDTEAGQRENTHSPAVTAADKCGSIVGEVKDCKGNFSCSDMGRTLDYGDNILMKDNLALKEDLSSCSNNNECFPDSSDELTDSDSDPEDLLSFSDFSLPSNPKASPSQPRNRIVYGAEERFNRKPVSAYPNNTFALGKFVQKAISGNAQTVAKTPSPVPQGTSKVVQNLNLVHGKPNLKKSPQISAVPNVFPRPINSNRSRDFPSSHATKSRTWHRTGSSSDAVAGPKLQPCPLPQSRETNMPRTAQSSYMRKGNSLVRKPSPSTATPPGLSSSVYKRSPCIDNLRKKQPSNGKIDGIDAPTVHRLEPVNICESPEAPPIERSVKSSNSTTCNLRESSSGNDCSSKSLGALDVIKKSSAIPENCQSVSRNNSDSQSTLDQRNSRKKIKYVKRRSNQLVAASDFEEDSISGVDKIQSSFSDGYFKSRKNQLVRASVAENHATNGDSVAEVNSSNLVLKELPLRSSGKRQSNKGSAKTYRSSKFSFVWKLHDVHSSQKHNHPERCQKVLSHLFPWKRATYRRSVMLALGSKPNNNYSAVSQKVLLSRKRGAVYTKSTHGYSLRMSKVLSVGGSSLKWSKSIERISKKTNEEATRAVAAAEKTKKEERIAVPVVSKRRNLVSRERIFRIGSERYKMDPTRRTLCRITEEKPSSSIVIQPEKIVKRSYVPKRLFIGNDEYVRIGTGNQLIRDPKKRTRVLASEKVRWSLRTARMRLARKRKYCQFFTRFGKCNKEDGKCPYIHDPSKIAVCTKFLSGSCSNPDCKLTHKVIPERMQDCSYFVKGSCSNENCPYRHVNVDPDSSVCESFLRGYCIDGNECRKKHTYVCPAFEETGICPQASTCKLHHPKKKTENKPKSEQKSVLGRYFDGGLIGVADCSSMDTSEKLSAKGKDDIGFSEGKFPDYMSLDVSDDEV